MINKRFLLGITSAAVLLFSSCKKETTKDVSKTLKVPEIAIIGGDFVSVSTGGTYTDEGATYTGEDGSTSTIQASVNDVNTAVPGLYFVEYEQESASGIFNTVGTRIVAVGYRDNTVDYSGNYLRAATGVSAIITRVAPGLYRVQNPGGAAGAHTGVVAYFVESTANNFIGPVQHDALVGDLEFADIAFTATEATWRILNSPYYGTAARFFVKQ